VVHDTQWAELSLVLDRRERQSIGRIEIGTRGMKELKENVAYIFRSNLNDKLSRALPTTAVSVTLEKAQLG